MPNYEHKKIIEMITQLDTPPSDVHAFAEWRRTVEIFCPPIRGS